MDEYYEKMKAAIERDDQARKNKGLSSRDVVAKNYSEAEWLELVERLKQLPDPTHAAFRLAAFIFERQSQRVPEPIQRKAADNVADHVMSGNDKTDDGAVRIFVNWGVQRKDYRVVCLSLLRHQNVMIRQEVLKCAGNFLRPSEYSYLFIFREDSYISEIAMGGPLRYTLRDYALDVLKWLTKCPVKEDDCFNDMPEGRVSYRSWSPFLNWFEKQGRKFS